MRSFETLQYDRYVTFSGEACNTIESHVKCDSIFLDPRFKFLHILILDSDSFKQVISITKTFCQQFFRPISFKTKVYSNYIRKYLCIHSFVESTAINSLLVYSQTVSNHSYIYYLTITHNTIKFAKRTKQYYMCCEK